MRPSLQFLANPYLQGVGLIAVGFLLILWMHPMLEVRGPLLMLLLTAVTLAAWRGGLGPGLMTLVLSVGLAVFLLEPLYDPRLSVPTDWFRLGMFLLLGGLISVISERRLRNARELRQVTEEAQRQKRLYETVLSSTPDLVYAFDLKHRFIYANEALLDMWGRTWEEGIGKTLLEVGYERWHAEMHERELDQVVATKRPVRGEVPFPHSRLGRRTYDYIFAPILGPDGAVEGVAGTTRDVTEQREAEQALRESEQRFRALFDQAGVGIVQADPGAHLLVVNDRFCSLVGYSREELLAMEDPVEDLSYPEDLPRIREALRGLSDGAGDVFEIEKRHVRKDGSVAWHAMSCSALRGGNGELESLMAVFQDITERKRTEERLEQLTRTLEQRVAERTAEAEKRAEQLRLMARELTEAEQRERRRLARLLHEDLQQILVAAQMKLDSAPDTTAAVDAAENLITQAIDTTRSLSTELVPPVLYDLGLGPALEWLGRWAQQQYALDVRVSADPGIEVPDEHLRVLVFQAVRELLLNVVKHAGVDAARVALEDAGEHLRVEVEDAGEGFDAEAVSESTDSGGHGLFSLRERLEVMGGGFELGSAPGRGTRVRLTLPLARSQSSLATAASVESRPRVSTNHGSGDGELAARVLLTDDHEVVRRGLADLIDAQPDMQVVAEAVSGEEAVELAQKHRPNVVVMDISLAGMSGIEATRLIMEEEPGICVIGLSVHQERDVADALRSAGGRAYFNKSQAAGELVRAIRQFTSASPPGEV